MSLAHPCLEGSCHNLSREGLTFLPWSVRCFSAGQSSSDHHVDGKLLRVHDAHLNAAKFHGHFYEPLDGGVLVHAGAPIFIVSDPVIEQLGVVCQDLFERP